MIFYFVLAPCVDELRAKSAVEPGLDLMSTGPAAALDLVIWITCTYSAMSLQCAAIHTANNSHHRIIAVLNGEAACVFQMKKGKFDFEPFDHLQDILV